MHGVAPHCPQQPGLDQAEARSLELQLGLPGGQVRSEPTAGAPDAHPPGTSVHSTPRTRSHNERGASSVVYWTRGRCTRSVTPKSEAATWALEAVRDGRVNRQGNATSVQLKQIRAGVGQAQGSIHSAGCAQERNVGVGEGTRATPSVPSPSAPSCPGLSPQTGRPGAGAASAGRTPGRGRSSN